MYRMLKKILITPLKVKSEREIRGLGEIETLGTAIKERANKLFGGSIAIREVAAGSSNAEEQELTALTNAYYDIERFGVRFVASPRHADMLFVTGPVSRNMADGVRHSYEAMPTPKWVVAVGDGAIDGGIYRDSYAVYNRVENLIPVDFKIPGDPPSPIAVLKALLAILDEIDTRRVEKS